MEPNERGHLVVAAEQAAQMRMFEFMLVALEVALEQERTTGQVEFRARLREGLRTFRGETLTLGLPEQVGAQLSGGLSLTTEQERLVIQCYRIYMNELTARVSALLDEFGD